MTKASGMGEVRFVFGGAAIGIGGVGLFRNKRPYITITDGSTIYTLGSLHPRISPEKFWELIGKVYGKEVVEPEDGKEQP